jgi:1-phosphofructokinase
MQPKVFTLTLNPCLDRYITIDNLVGDTTIRGGVTTTKIGGKGITVSRVLKQLGIKSKLITIIGGPIGDDLKQKLADEKLDFEVIESVVETRICSNIMTKDGKNYKINEKGGVQNLETQQKVLEVVRKYLVSDQIWVLGGSLPLGFDDSFYFHLINLIQENGSISILDSSGQGLVEGLKANPFLIKPNIHETENYFGSKIKNIDDAKKLVQNYLDLGIPFVMQSLGSNGLVYGFKNEIKHIPANKVEVKNLVGAGDSLVAGLVFGLVQGWDFAKIAKYGVDVSSQYVKCEDLTKIKDKILP